MVSVIWADGLWICCRSGEATWRIPRKRTWRHGCTLISASKTPVWDSVTAMFSRTVMHGCWRSPCRAIPPKGLCPPLCGTCSRKARRIELNGSISPGSREVRTTWSSHFESSLMESILEYSITYPEVKKHCSLRHMQTARIQLVSATAGFGSACFDCSLAISSSHTSLGVLYPRSFMGVSLISPTIASSSSCVRSSKLVPLGR